MLSMSGAGGRADHGGGQLYGNHQTAPFCVNGGGDDEDVGSSSMFFQNSACGGAMDAGEGATPYSSITDYLQGFLDPAGLARHLDEPPVYAAGERQLAAGDVIGRDDRHGRQADAGAPTTITPNTSTSVEEEVDEEQRRCRRGRAEGVDREGEIAEEKSANHQNHRGDTKKKKKGKTEKKVRGSRVAFATKSEVDHLDDGYRWRKYGQKAVKNSSFPRSYYRCTAARCGVKKQVERSQQDPSTVVTTYEGQHAHPSPAAHRGLAAGGANGLYALAALQQQRHSFSPSQDDFIAATVHPMTPSPAALLPRQAEHRLAECYGQQLHHVFPDHHLAGNQHEHR